MATWRSGYAEVCKTLYPGSIPGVASIPPQNELQAPRRRTPARIASRESRPFLHPALADSRARPAPPASKQCRATTGPGRKLCPQEHNFAPLFAPSKRRHAKCAQTFSEGYRKTIARHLRRRPGPTADRVGPATTVNHLLTIWDQCLPRLPMKTPHHYPNFGPGSCRALFLWA